MPEIGDMKTLAEMDLTPEIHKLYPEFDEIYRKRNTLTDRLAQLEDRAQGRPSFEKRLDKLFEQREQADADLVGIRVKIAKEHPELAYRTPLKPWESEKFLTSQWRRGWHLRPGKDLTCTCSYQIRVPSKKLSPRKRYNLLQKAIEKHRLYCPEWQRLTSKPSLSIRERGTLGRKGTPRITPKTPRLRR